MDDCQLGITTEMIGCAKKIMFSDLRNMQLSKTMEVKTWNRVLVENIHVQQKKAHVLYIDYGSGELITVVKRFVASVIPAEGRCDNDCANAVKPVIVEQYCSSKIFDILQEEMISFAGDVWLLGSGASEKIVWKHETPPSQFV